MQEEADFYYKRQIYIQALEILMEQGMLREQEKNEIQLLIMKEHPMEV